MANKKNRRWVRNTLISTFFLSIFFSGISQLFLGDSACLTASLIVLMLIILTGVIFDIIGVAATSSKMAPLNARGAKKVPGARAAINLARNSEKVSSFCNDVVGDICGIISGSAAAAIVFNLAANNSKQGYINIIFGAIVAALTVGGKALSKSTAINYSTEILMLAGKVISFFQKLNPFHKAKDRGNNGK